MNEKLEMPSRLFFSKVWIPFRDFYSENQSLFVGLDTETIHTLLEEKVAWGYKENKNRKLTPQSTKNRIVLTQDKDRFLMTKSTFASKPQLSTECTFKVKKCGKNRALLEGVMEFDNQKSTPIRQVIQHPCENHHIYFLAFYELLVIAESLSITHIHFHVQSLYATRLFNDLLIPKAPMGWAENYSRLHAKKKQFVSCTVDQRVPSNHQLFMKPELKKVKVYNKPHFSKKKKVIVKIAEPPNITSHIQNLIEKCPFPVKYIVWTDAGLRKWSRTSVISFVVRKVSGELIQKCVVPSKHISAVIKAEHEALLYANEYVKTNGLDNVLFLTDCLPMVARYQTSLQETSMRASLSLGKTSTFSHCEHVALFWIERKYNKEADGLCREGFIRFAPKVDIVEAVPLSHA